MGPELDLNECKGFAGCAALCSIVYLNSLNPRLFMLESRGDLVGHKDALCELWKREEFCCSGCQMPEELENRAERMRQTCGNLVYKIRKWGSKRFYSS